MEVILGGGVVSGPPGLCGGPHHDDQVQGHSGEEITNVGKREGGRGGFKEIRLNDVERV